MFLPTLLLALTARDLGTCVQVAIAGYPEIVGAELDLPQEWSHSGLRHRGPVERLIYLTVAKNIRTSSTKSSGCSNAAKCPPWGMFVQCVML
jgi:hypothetical protein